MSLVRFDELVLFADRYVIPPDLIKRVAMVVLNQLLDAICKHLIYDRVNIHRH